MVKNIAEQHLKNILPNVLKDHGKTQKANRTNQVFKDGVFPLPILTADPSTTYPAIYYNSTTNHIRGYIIGTGWVTIV